MHPGQKLKPGAVVRFEGAAGVLMGEVLERHFHGRRTIRLWAEPGARDVARSMRSGTCRCRRTSGARTRLPIASGIRPCSRVCAGRLRRRRRGCTSRRSWSRVGGARRRARGGHAPRRLRNVQAGQGRSRRGSRRRWRAVHDCGGRGRDHRARAEGRRVIAVGTTTTRALEDAAGRGGGVVRPGTATAEIFIYPGRRVPGHRRPADELPPSEVVAADARVGVRRPRAGPARVSGSGQGALPVLQLRGCDVGHVGSRL